MKVTAIGTLTPAQQKQLAYDMLEFLYQAHRQADKNRVPTPEPGLHDPAAPCHSPRS